MESHSKRDMVERLSFVRLWANHIRVSTDAQWSRQQAVLINSVLESANFDLGLYLKVKKIAQKGR